MRDDGAKFDRCGMHAGWAHIAYIGHAMLSSSIASIRAQLIHRKRADGVMGYKTDINK